jgi:hypothetical protein
MTDYTAMTDYTGLWCTADDSVRHELRPDGRYVEARGTREAAYTGRYELTGDHIDYWDDSGFTAVGDFVDGVLHHAGMIMHRRPVPGSSSSG